jgi:hypothetical protein
VLVLRRHQKLDRLVHIVLQVHRHFADDALDTLRTQLLPATVGKVAGVEYAVTGDTAASKDWNEKMRESLIKEQDKGSGGMSGRRIPCLRSMIARSRDCRDDLASVFYVGLWLGLALCRNRQYALL